MSTENDKSTEISLTENKALLSAESVDILNKIIAENDTTKVKDLTYLFNINQNKKIMARINKLNDLYDVIADQALQRFSKRPEEMSNQEMLQALKIVQEITERGLKQVNGINDTPLIQINNQTNEINLGESNKDVLSKESRDRINEAVMSILNNSKNISANKENDDIIEVVEEE